MGRTKRDSWDGSDWNDGYVAQGRFWVYRPDHPDVAKGGYIFRSRVVWWLHYGKAAPDGMDIHHKNGDRLDDRLENLELLGHGEHTSLHHSLPGVEIVCVGCGKPFRVPAWRMRSRAKRGTTVKFCSNACRCTNPYGEAKDKLICITGAAGFIGHWLVRYLKQKGCRVRAVDIKQPEWSPLDMADDNWWGCDLRNYNNALAAVTGCEEVYALAATMGGVGFIGTGDNDVAIMCDNALININTLDAALQSGVRRYLFSSSACVYRQDLQAETNAGSLKEEDAFPAFPDSSYGWEKLYTELLCQAYINASDMNIRIARFHNIMGPESSWNDGREKLPAAACRKVATAKHTSNPEVEIWGTGEQRRSFCYIDDCVEMIYRLMESDYPYPMNIGTDRSVSVNEVFGIVADFAKVQIVKKHIPGPLGVQGRNADLSLMRNILKYEPQVSLEEGLARTYTWIEEMVAKEQSN